MPLVKKINDVWTRIQGTVQLTQIVDTAEVHYHDGRQREISVTDLNEEPYEVSTAPMDANTIESLYLAGTWTVDDLTKYGLRYAEPFDVPQGKRIVGSPTYVEENDKIVEVYEVEDIPPPDYLTMPINRIQFMFVLTKMNLKSAVENAIASMPAETEDEVNKKIMAQVMYETGQEFYRDHEFFDMLAPAVGLTSEQLDDLWIIAHGV